MKITAAVVPARSIPFEIETLDLTAPLADGVLVRVVASDSMCHTDLHARDGYFPNLPYPAGSDCNGSCPSRACTEKRFQNVRLAWPALPELA